MKDNQTLTYEEFVADHPRIPQIPRYDNFPLTFVDTEDNPMR